MIVKDLIKELQQMPVDTLVVVKGYESGFDDVKGVNQVKLEFSTSKQDWDGVYMSAQSSTSNPIKAVFIEPYDADDKHTMERPFASGHTEADRAAWFVHVIQYTAEDLNLSVRDTVELLEKYGKVAPLLSGYDVWHTQGFEYMAEMLTEELQKAQGGKDDEQL